MKTLKEVLNILDINCESEKEVLGITSDSRKVKEGYIFVAVNGIHYKGKDFIKDAYNNGAIACINEEIEDEFTFKTNNLKDKLHLLAQSIYDIDFNKFKITAITGTNGKTTTSTLVYKCMRKSNINVTLVGTNGVYYNEDHYVLNNTTPNILDLYSIFYESKKRDIYNIIMEVSSHAIELERIKSISFDVICYTNLSHDHLDFHKTMENYALSKYKLINHLKHNGVIIYNKDDPYFNKYYNFQNHKVITYGINESDYKINNIKLSHLGSSFMISNKYIESKLTCMFNIYNLTLAYLILLNYDFKSTDIIKKLKIIDNIDGRMQKIEVNKRYFYIDFAHSPDSIDKVLSFVKPLCKKRLIVVFGSGGDRDKLKRPKMLKICLKYANKIYVTSDNPRYEDPYIIIQDVIKNKMSHKINVFLSREDAIVDAYKYSNDNDIIVLLGKGNEPYQIINDIKIPYNDLEVINRCLLNLESSYI